jgi:acetolactate synthase I/II/III large subunit
MNGAECLLRTLVSNGVDVCFMNPGTSEMQFVAALDRVGGMRPVLCLFEGVCSGAADGYARMTGRPASTLLHLGPGLANGLSNFHNARKARSPIVSIVGEHSTQHQNHDAPLSADIAAFARSVTNQVRTVATAQAAGLAASETLAAAVQAPGQPAMLIVPADFSWSEAGSPGPIVPKPVKRMPEMGRVRELALRLQSGGAAGLLLGGRTLTGRGLEAAARLAYSTGVKVFADRNAARMESGRGRFQPQRIAYFPEQAAAQLSGLRDLILVEAKPPVSFFGYPDQPSFLAPTGCGIHTLAQLHEDGTTALEALAGECKAVAAPLPEQPCAEVSWEAQSCLTPDAVGAIVGALLPDDAIVSDEMVSASGAVWPHLTKAARHDFLPVTGGSIGQGLPVALGAAIACPDRKVVALEADGSGMYTLQALWSMARENAEVTVVIFANGRYRILDIEMRRTGASGFGSVAESMIDIGRPQLDWVKLSESMGVPAMRAETAGEFENAFRSALAVRGPRLVEARIQD